MSCDVWVYIVCVCMHLGIVSVVCSAHHSVTVKLKLLAESRHNLRCIYVASRIYFHWPTSENRQRRSNKKLRFWNGTDGLQYAIHRQDYWIIEWLVFVRWLMSNTKWTHIIFEITEIFFTFLHLLSTIQA